MPNEMMKPANVDASQLVVRNETGSALRTPAECNRLTYTGQGCDSVPLRETRAFRHTISIDVP